MPQASLSALSGIEPDVVSSLLRGLEEAGLISRGYDLWGEVEVRRVDEEPEDLREDVARVHAALPGEGIVTLPALARRADVRPVVVQSALFHLMADGIVEAVPGGSLIDIRLKKESLDGGSRRRISARLKSRTRAAYDQVQIVETYAALQTCRREYLLRHFGDEQKVAPCGGCDVCLGEADEIARAKPNLPLSYAGPGRFEPAAPRDSGTPSAAFDAELFERLRAWRGEQARHQQVPAYVVLHNSHLEEIARYKPGSVRELGSIKGIGLRRAARYGDEILALVRGEKPASSRGGPDDDPAPDYHRHLEAAERLLRSGRGAAAVPELARALEVGGEEAQRIIDNMLTLDTTLRADDLQSVHRISK